MVEFNKLGNPTAKSTSKELSCILEAYTSFCDKASTDNHGKTAQYWIVHINLVKMCYEFSKSIRAGELEFHIHCLIKLAYLHSPITIMESG